MESDRLRDRTAERLAVVYALFGGLVALVLLRVWWMLRQVHRDVKVLRDALGEGFPPAPPPAATSADPDDPFAPHR